MEKEKFMIRIMVCVVVVVLLAGCSGLGFTDDTTEPAPETTSEDPTDPADGDGETDTDQESDGSGESENRDEDASTTDGTDTDQAESNEIDGPDAYVNTVETVDSTTADGFTAAVTDDSGEFTDNALELFGLFEETDSFREDERATIATRVADEGQVSDQVLTKVERTRLSSTAVQRAVFRTGFDNSNGGALLDGEAQLFGIDPSTSDSEVAEIAEPLGEDGYDEDDVAYLQRVSELAQYQDNEYEGWHQAAELGLLHETTADGDVDEDDLWAIQNDDSDRLINAMEEEFGTDPNSADTSGDGFEDHLKWGPLQDLGVEVNPGEIDIYVEMDTVQGADDITIRQRNLITSTMSRETGDDMPRANMHFEQCQANVERVFSTEEMTETARENHQARGYGFHYFLVNNGNIDSQDGDRLQGQSRSSTAGVSWVIANIDPDMGANVQASLIAHEFGHAFGIFPRDFAGVDSRDYSATQYNSVMNYNLRNTVTFSTGSPFDDYAEMQRNDFGQRYQSRTDLQAAWENGGLPEEQPCGGF